MYRALNPVPGADSPTAPPPPAPNSSRPKHQASDDTGTVSPDSELGNVWTQPVFLQPHGVDHGHHECALLGEKLQAALFLPCSLK